MGSGWAKLGIAIGGAILGGWIAGPIGMSAGFLAGSFLGSQLFPTDYESKMPPVHDYPVQSSSVGTPIAVVYGGVRIAGNVIWMGALQSYQIAHSVGGGGGKGGGGDEQVSYETKYRRSFLISICEGPATIARAWKGKEEILTSEFTSYDGDGNSGIGTLIGKPYAEYSNLCLAYFENYELGNSQALPNFTFEVSGDPSLKVCDLAVGGTHMELVEGEDSVAEMYNLQGKFSHTLAHFDTQADRLHRCTKIVKHPNGNYFCALEKHVTKYPYGATSWFRCVNQLGDTIWEAGYNFQYCRDIHIDSEGYVYACFGKSGIGNYDMLYKYHPDSNVPIWSSVAITSAGNTTGLDEYAGDFAEVGIYALHGSKIFRITKSDGTEEWTKTVQYTTGRIKLDTKACMYTNGLKGGKGCVCYEPKSAFWGASEQYVFEDSDRQTIGLMVIEPSGASAYQALIYVGVHGPGVDYVAMLGLYPVGGIFTPGFNYITKYDIGAAVHDIVLDVDGGLLVTHDRGTGEGGGTGHVTKLNDCLGYGGVIDFQKDRADFVMSLARGSGDAIYGPGPDDIDFASMIKDLLINKKYGNYNESDLITEDFNSIIQYCVENDLKGSLAITDQKPLPDWIAYICSHFQGYFYEIGGKVGLNCYRDQSSILSITQDDLVRDGDEPPVHTTKRAYSSTYNRLEATWTNRDNDYKTAVVPAFDRIDQREAGQVRTKIMDLKAITNQELAAKMAWRVFIDQIYRFSQYAFKLGYKSMLLEVGNVIDVTDGDSLVSKKMRVMSISEEKDGRKALITAVEDISSFYPSLQYAIQQSEAVDDPDISLTDGTVVFREDWINNRLYLSITPGGTQCNGFYIYRSYDDESYELVGKSAIGGVTGGEANSTGTIQSNLLAHTTVIHRKDEAFDASIGVITDLDTSITDDDFFNNRKLARIGDEIIAYKTCVESSTEGTWRVSNLIRGLFATKPVAHVPGEVFNTLDVSLIYTLRESDVGKTIYFKVVSFYAKKVQPISEVSPQSYVVSGKYLKPLPVSLMRINGREGLSTYKTADVVLDWYFCSKTSGFGRGGYGNALWGAYIKDPLLERLKVELEEGDGTPIIDADFELDDYGEPAQLEILGADRDGKNPVRVKMTPGSHLWSDETRDILIEKI